LHRIYEMRIRESNMRSEGKVKIPCAVEKTIKILE
jgi:hypothetical protein